MGDTGIHQLKDLLLAFAQVEVDLTRHVVNLYDHQGGVVVLEAVHLHSKEASCHPSLQGQLSILCLLES